MCVRVFVSVFWCLVGVDTGWWFAQPAHVPTGFLLGGGTDPDSADILAQYQKQVSEAVAIYEENIWRELEPEQALALTQTEEEVKKLGSTLQVCAWQRPPSGSANVSLSHRSSVMKLSRKSAHKKSCCEIFALRCVWVCAFPGFPRM